MRVKVLFSILVILSLTTSTVLASGPYAVKFPVTKSGIDPQAVTVVGTPQRHVIKKGEDLLEIARHYGLGYNSISMMHRDWDPFLPPAGTEILIPSQWIVPDFRGPQMLVNTGSMRLYYFTQNGTRVYTFPIGMGVLDFKTPSGNFRIVEKKVRPAWHIPKSLQAKYGMSVMPPGPDNPLGEYKLTLSWGDYGIHGTHMPWGVGRLVSHGCTRMYPEHIKQLFPLVPVGTAVEYIYEPALVGFKNGRVYLSVHEDYYFKIRSMIFHVLGMLESRGLTGLVNMLRVMQAVEEQNGVAMDISQEATGGMMSRP
ncbi:MAG: L,D-transpeptidase family protein [Desulfobaccales bacterium]